MVLSVVVYGIGAAAVSDGASQAALLHLLPVVAVHRKTQTAALRIVQAALDGGGMRDVCVLLLGRLWCARPGDPELLELLERLLRTLSYNAGRALTCAPRERATRQAELVASSVATLGVCRQSPREALVLAPSLLQLLECPLAVVLEHALQGLAQLCRSGELAFLPCWRAVERVLGDRAVISAQHGTRVGVALLQLLSCALPGLEEYQELENERASMAEQAEEVTDDVLGPYATVIELTVQAARDVLGGGWATDGVRAAAYTLLEEAVHMQLDAAPLLALCDEGEGRCQMRDMLLSETAAADATPMSVGACEALVVAVLTAQSHTCSHFAPRRADAVRRPTP